MSITTVLILIIILLIILLGILVYTFLKVKKKKSDYEEKYSGLISVDEEIKKRKKAYSLESEKLKNQDAELKIRFQNLKEKYSNASKVYEKLVYESNLLKDDLEIAEFGIYTPHFDYETSEKFKNKIIQIRDDQKRLIKEKRAIVGGENWTVNGSLPKGKVMINRQKKLMLRAFNGECNDFISGVSWNNITRMEERIGKSFIAINKMGDTQGVSISSRYQELKRAELRLTYEYKLKKYEEKEEQRAIKAQIREEEKARKDFERAQKEAEKEAKLLQQAMEKARAELGKSSEKERAKYEKELETLKAQLLIAEEKNQRAISMAQQTRAGHVYVISNLGSFGSDVYKIGMTRRLEPLDRVRELGDASVPFKFDVHAMIYSEDAPRLENTLHKAFEKNRMNYVNRRREYFKITLSEIETLVLENHGEIEFLHDPEAREYRESKIIRDQILKNDKADELEPAFPSTIDLFREE